MVQYQFVGRITHYFDRIGVAVMLVEAELYIGDWILIQGPHTQIEQQVASMQIDRAPIEQALPGDDIGLKVIEPVQDGDEVYLILNDE